MNIRQFGIGAAVCVAMGLFAQTAVSKELSVATVLRPHHHTNAGMVSWFAEEIDKRSGGALTMKLYPSGQLGAGPVPQYNRPVEGVADITFGVSGYTPALFPKTMLAVGTVAGNHFAATRDLSTMDGMKGAKMDAAVATGLEQVFTDYKERGIADVRTIYDALNI